MQSVGPKKNPRVRNRPKNKCNRPANEVEDIVSSTQTEIAAEPTAVTAPNYDAIKIIQQLLRKKLLAKGKQQEQPAKSNETTMKAELLKLPSPELPPPVAQSRQEVQTTNAMSELFKCLGSKMQGQEATNGTPAVTLLSSLGMMLNQAPVSDIESSSSDEEAEYVEYIYTPRQYFMASLCNLCKTNLLVPTQQLPCKRCGLSYYCSVAHMQEDQQHRQLCYALRQLVEHNGHDVFYKCGEFSSEQFRSYRIVCIRQVEKTMNRSLSATEQEVLLFPRICSNIKCREHRFRNLQVCAQCGEVAYCKSKPEHLNPMHTSWCAAYRLFKAFIMFQAKFGRLEPSLPDKVLKELPMACCNTKQIMKKLNFVVTDQCEHAALTQLSTGPLTAWYALKLCERLHSGEELTVQLIGAEIEFEVDMLQKWELFLLHIMPAVRTLNVIFIGPELNARNISFEQLKKIKCCRICRQAQRTVQYYFENCFFHDYCGGLSFRQPDLVCFFNPGLYRATGFAFEDSWPDTIRAALNLKCPIVVTSYTKYEAPLDMSRFVNESNRHLNVVLPPTTNPFASEKPERNFISDEEVPFMFKNFYCFVIE